MPPLLRPNWTVVDFGGGFAPPGLEVFAVVGQPVPSSDQAATIIRVWANFSNAVDSDPTTFVFTCWEASITNNGVFAGGRQIGGAYTITAPGIGMGGDFFVIPTFFQWIDNARSQSAVYMIAYDNTDAEGGFVDSLTSALTAIGA